MGDCKPVKLVQDGGDVGERWGSRYITGGRLMHQLKLVEGFRGETIYEGGAESVSIAEVNVSRPGDVGMK